MTKEKIIEYLKTNKTHIWIEKYAFCCNCDNSSYEGDLYKFKEEYICDDCVYDSNYLIIEDRAYETCNLQENIIVLNGDNYYKIHEIIYVPYTYLTDNFHHCMTNIEWYKYCFTNVQNIEDVTIEFDIFDKNHMWLFKQCTRFNHYSNYVDYNITCFYYNTNHETSVEQILDNIVTLRMVMLRHYVPRCLRDYIITLYLKF